MIQTGISVLKCLVIPCSATAPPDIVGVWTAQARRGQEPGRRPVQHQKTATNQVTKRDTSKIIKASLLEFDRLLILFYFFSNQMNQSVLKLSVSTTETVYKPPVQRDILFLELMCHSVMTMDNTYLCRFVTHFWEK